MFIDHFLKHGMPLLDVLFRRRKDDCVSLLKKLQLSTRYLQHVCSHSKINKDVSLSNHVPFLKKSLEAFLFRVKATLATNNVAGAFWMGNLKNRDLKGEEIVSQDEEEEESDEDQDAAAPQNDDDEEQSEVELSDNESAASARRNVSSPGREEESVEI